MLAGIQVAGFRNLAAQTVAFPGNLALVRGRNAQGKTALLEAVYLLATTRSFRTTDPREAIAYPEAALVVRGWGEVGGVPGSWGVQVGRRRGERTLTHGEKKVRLHDYLAGIPALVLTGQSLHLVSGSPAERRRLVDRAVAAAAPEHLRDLAHYRRALAQRNQLLKDQAPDAQLVPWDEILAREGESLRHRRERFISLWNKELIDFKELFPEAEKSSLLIKENRARTAPEGEKIGLLENLRRLRPQERRLGLTLTGPHRDDLVLEAEGKDLFRFGSSGQVRSALAALTFAQARHVRRERAGETPLLLLDDVDTDLDPGRCAALLRAARKEGQVIAATSKPLLPDLEEARVLTVEAGRIGGPGEATGFHT